MAHQDVIGHASRGRRVPGNAAGLDLRAHRRQRRDHRQVPDVAGRSAVIIHVGLGFVYAAVHRAVAKETGSRVSAGGGAGRAAAPAPRLQQFPANEIYQFRPTRTRCSNGYGWMNEEAGIVHIPIEEAMRLTVERGLPSRAAGAGADRATTPGHDAVGLKLQGGRWSRRRQ